MRIDQTERIVQLKRLLQSEGAVREVVAENKERLYDEIIGMFRRGEEERLIFVRLAQLSAYEEILETYRNAEEEFETLTKEEQQ